MIKGDLIFAATKGIRITTNNKVETTAVLHGLRFCTQQGFSRVILETDSMAMRNMLMREWKIPWELIEIIEEARDIVEKYQYRVTHVYREGNQLADALANHAIDKNERCTYSMFAQLPKRCTAILNMDKHQMTSLRIRSRKIKEICNQHG